MDSPKGSKEYNPNQSFALQVFWIVRSPKAAKEMIEKGFLPCAKAAMRDTPTTLAYLFRISRDQSAAEEYKKTILTIGQHPHYQSIFKSLQMGLPLASMELKLRNGGIKTEPLSWNPDTLISGHEQELDFDPVVLECTEVYLDDQSFYEHSASREWMKNSADILLPARSLKPTTYCLGNPSKDIWDKAIEPSLKAIRFDDDDRETVKVLRPGVFFYHDHKTDEKNIVFVDFDLVCSNNKLFECRENMSSIQQELQAQLMIIIPTNLEQENSNLKIRLTLSFIYKGVKSNALRQLKMNSVELKGRIISYGGAQCGKKFIEDCGVELECIDAEAAEKECIVAGYPMHPLYSSLVQDSNRHYVI